MGGFNPGVNYTQLGLIFGKQRSFWLYLNKIMY